MTSSGIGIKTWVNLLVIAQKSAGRHGGPGMLKKDDTMLNTSELDAWLHSYLLRFLEEKTKFPLEIQNEEDITERFSLFRSLKRASDTRSLEKIFSGSDIDIVNRWKTLESADVKRPGTKMRYHCTEVSFLKAPLLRHTWAILNQLSMVTHS